MKFEIFVDGAETPLTTVDLSDSCVYPNRALWMKAPRGGFMASTQLGCMILVPRRPGSVAASGGTHQGSKVFKTNIPGKVTRVLCKVGDFVVPGQGLMVIEAMKMENEIKATHAGTVEEVLVKEGQRIESGSGLLRLGPVGDAVI